MADFPDVMLTIAIGLNFPEGALVPTVVICLTLQLRYPSFVRSLMQEWIHSSRNEAC